MWYRIAKSDIEKLIADENLLASVVVLCKHGDKVKVLIEKRGSKPKKHKWALPGGHVEKGESIKEGAAREVKEETDVDIKPDDLMLIDQMINEKGKHNYFYCVLLDEDHPAKSGSDAEKAEWHDVDDLPNLAWDNEDYVQKAVRKLL